MPVNKEIYVPLGILDSPASYEIEPHVFDIVGGVLFTVRTDKYSVICK